MMMMMIIIIIIIIRIIIIIIIIIIRRRRRRRRRIQGIKRENFSKTGAPGRSVGRARDSRSRGLGIKTRAGYLVMESIST